MLGMDLSLSTILVVYGDSSVSICRGSCGGSDHCAWPEVTSPEVTGLFPLLFPRPCSRTFFSSTFFRNFCFPIFLVLFSSYYFPVFCFRTFFPYFFYSTFFPYYFPVLFQKSRRLKSNVLKYQLVVFLVHVVISQFIFLAEKPLKRHQ